MEPTIRPAAEEDAAECGRILYAAFQTLADRHGFPRDFPSVEAATEVAGFLLGDPAFAGFVAEAEGRILGSNFMHLGPPIAGIGPISVDPAAQDRGVGRRLMLAAMARAEMDGLAGVRLAQTAYHNRSLCLYTRLGFRTRAALSLMQGKPLRVTLPGYDVRPATAADLPACNRLCHDVHGFDRGGELRAAIARDTAVVVEHLGRITGYATAIGFFAHAVGETNRDVTALIGAAAAFEGPGFLVPTENHELFAWCLDHGLRLVMQMNLMSTGLYAEPAGAWLPSVLY